ncbi:aconitase family protein, partial [Shigella sonnei]|uniref:aconitase family protein n=1 Tax=Shigella sonnei TaxID=624 RepID=UPI0020A6A926
GAGGATGYAVEYAGPVIAGLSVEERLTVCNMSIEAGARSGTIAPDDTTFAYLHGRPYAPKDAAWDRAVAYWRTLPTDDDARFDR